MKKFGNIALSYNLSFTVIPNVFSGKCVPVTVRGDRKICVCNDDYCDTIEPVKKIEQGQFLRYTSDKSGLRFEQESGKFTNTTSSKKKIVIRSGQVFQKIFGFGGAFTDATGDNLMALNPSLREKLIR